MISKQLIDELNYLLNKIDIRELQEINSSLLLKEFEPLSLELHSWHHGLPLILSLIDEILELKKEIKNLKNNKNI
jgi:hypothetical protein